MEAMSGVNITEFDVLNSFMHFSLERALIFFLVVYCLPILLFSIMSRPSVYFIVNNRFVPCHFLFIKQVKIDSLLWKFVVLRYVSVFSI